MSRLPPLPRASLSGDQQEAHDDLLAKTQTAFGPNGSIVTYQNNQGALIGPYPFYLAVPGAGVSAFNHALALAQLPLSPAVVEIAILTAGSQYQAAYQLYAHGKIGVHVGLSEIQVDSLKAGRKPEDLDERGSVAFDVALHLSTKPGVLPHSLWERSVEALGRDETVALVHYVGFYAYMCIAMNAIDATVPADA